MQHIAIMQKTWGLTEKIATGHKTIESRWYNIKYPPWGKITPGDTIYFKNTGQPITIRAQATKILTFANLTPQQVHALLQQYGPACGIEPDQLPTYYHRFQHKRYAILIFLTNPQRIAPINIDTASFSKRASWICIDNVTSLAAPP